MKSTWTAHRCPLLKFFNEGNLSMPKGRYRTSLLAGLAMVLLLTSPLFAQAASPMRPKITGISHVGYFVSDLPKGGRVLARFSGFR